MPNRNSMLEYRYMQDSNRLAYTLNNFLDNLPSSKFEGVYSDDLNFNVMSMSVPNARYFESVAAVHPFSSEQETKSFNTETMTYPTTYVGTSESLSCTVPMAHENVKPRNSGSSFFDATRGYDSEPNWSDRSIEHVAKKTWNYHDDMTRKWVERGTNNFRKSSMSLNIVKQWNEFDDDNHSKFATSKRRRNPVDRRLDDVRLRRNEHSKNLQETVTTEHDKEKDKQFARLSKEIGEPKPTTTEAKTDSKNQKIHKERNAKKCSPSGSDSGSDDVFESPNSKPNPRFIKRRSSSLDALPSCPPFSSNQLTNRNRSSVCIKDKPEYCEFDPKSSTLSDSRNPSSVANSASTFHKSLGAPPLPPTLKRASLKKSSNEHSKQSNDYDVRDRGRGRNSNGGRDSYRDRHHRERDADRGLSDREQRESYNRSSFNRSMSNAEGTPDDKIGEIVFFQFNFSVNIYSWSQT